MEFLNLLHRCIETVADPRQRFDVTGFGGGIVERGAELADGGVEAMLEIHKRVVGPELAANLLAGDDVAGADEQEV